MKPYTLVADLHAHTIASDHAFSTVGELAQSAANRGLFAVGCTDHGPACEDAPHIWHFQTLDFLPDTIHGVRVLRGAEANILDYDGRLDLDDSTLSRLELVIASMHGGIMAAGNVEQMTRAYLSVADNPYVDIIGHSGAPQFAYDYEAVIPVFGQKGKAVEINENSYRVRKSSLENCKAIARLCKKYSVPIVVSSDAHHDSAVGVTPHCFELLAEVDFPPELIINASLDTLRRFFEHKHIVL